MIIHVIIIESKKIPGRVSIRPKQSEKLLKLSLT